MLVDDKFILVFGGAADNTSFKFNLENNLVEKAHDMDKDSWLAHMPEPFYDKHTKAIYVCVRKNKLQKFDQDQKWSLARENIYMSAI